MFYYNGKQCPTCEQLKREEQGAERITSTNAPKVSQICLLNRGKHAVVLHALHERFHSFRSRLGVLASTWHVDDERWNFFYFFYFHLRTAQLYFWTFMTHFAKQGTCNREKLLQKRKVEFSDDDLAGCRRGRRLINKGIRALETVSGLVLSF